MLYPGKVLVIKISYVVKTFTLQKEFVVFVIVNKLFIVKHRFCREKSMN